MPSTRSKPRKEARSEPNSNAVLLELLRDLGLEKLQVPADFPLGTADFLRGEGIELVIAAEPLFPQRKIKDAEEIESMRRAMRAAEAGMETAIEGLRAAEVRDDVLFLNGDVLTSERLRRMVHQTLMDCDSIGEHTIIAGGDQGCDPHQVGFGPLRASETIIIDIFPRDEASGYYGDLTRTVCKGQASKPMQHLYETVLEAQQLGLDHIRPGAEGHLIHESIQRFFNDAGYETGEKDGYMQGYIHSTGHGLGLEIHEGPRIGPHGDVLESGHVVTMEPGLYYRGLGGRADRRYGRRLRRRLRKPIQPAQGARSVNAALFVNGSTRCTRKGKLSRFISMRRHKFTLGSLVIAAGLIYLFMSLASSSQRRLT